MSHTRHAERPGTLPGDLIIWVLIVSGLAGAIGAFLLLLRGIRLIPAL